MSVHQWCEQNANWIPLSYSSNCSIFSAKLLETTSITKKQQNLKNGKVRFRLNIDVRKEMEDSRPNALKLITFVKGRLNFSCKSTTAANIDLTKSLLDNWLKNIHITVDKIYYLCCLFEFFLRILVFKFISQPQKTGTKTESCGNSLKLDLSEKANQMGASVVRWDLWLTGWTPQPRYIGSLRV